MFLFGGARILCPFCFKQVDKSKLPYGCNKTTCTGKDPIHIIVGNKGKNGFCICDKCNRSTSIRVCPECNMQLPDNIQEDSTQIVSIVGAKSSGKSYYVASLLRQIYDRGFLATNYQASSRWLLNSNFEYTTRYKNNLDKHMRLRGTNLETNVVKDNPPLLLEITFPKVRSQKVFSFFDAAGENFNDPREADAIRPYIAHSSAVILILDPLQIPRLKENITRQFSGMTGSSEITFSEIIDGTTNIIREELRIHNGKKIEIPLCIAISKWDLVLNTPGLVPEGLLISKQNIQNFGSYDPSITESASQELRSLLSEWEPNLIAMAENNYSEVKYFGFSSWGLVNSSTNTVPEIVPYRVEEPMLWVWKRMKLI